jgi:hypothetical protein
MKIKIGTWTDERTGEVKDRYLLFGKVMKSKFGTVGAKGTSKLDIFLSPGMGEQLERIAMWGYDALAYNGIQKFATMLVEAYEDAREWQGKTYVDYIALNVIDVSEKRGKAAPKKANEVEPQDPMEGFTDINSDDLPF